MIYLKTFEDRKKYLLDICTEIDKFCRQNGIEYSLAFGTLIGAYRHGGFIPWDDDFDILMTRENYEKFINSFAHSRYKCLTCYNSNKHLFPFARIVDTKTYSLSSKNNIFGKKIKGPGIPIDLYIVENLPSSISERKKLYDKLDKINYSRKIAWKIRKILFRFRFINLAYNFFPLIWLSKKEYELNINIKDPDKEKVFICSGDYKRILPANLFNHYTDCKFENRTFRTVSKYNELLTYQFDNWRLPPPPEKRIPCHGGNFFID